MPSPPVIGIDGSRLTVGKRTGTETYTAQLLAGLGRLEPRETLRVYLNARNAPPELGPRFEVTPIRFPRLWTHGRLSWEMLRRPPDVLFIPGHVVPLWHPRTVVTIHDLGYRHEPQAHPLRDRRYLTWSTRWSACAARRVITVSEATRRDLAELEGVPAERIRVVYHGVHARFRPLPAAEVAAIRQRLGLPPAFVLTVGTVQPRKNLGALARAMRTVTAAGLPQHLVVAGKRGWLAERVEREVASSGLGERVHWLGYVAGEDLPALYCAADAFCLPSLYEGFGLPAMEAMACGVPTLLSNRGALPEVAGDAGLLVHPSDADATGGALVRLLTDPVLRERLISAGNSRASRFTWDHCAIETIAVLREALDA